MKKFILLLLSVLVLSACASGTNEKEADMELVLSKTILRANGELEFDLYINRPDLGLNQPDNEDGELYASDLPKGLRVSSMYVSGAEDSRDAQAGVMCNTVLFPHRCSVERTSDDNYYVKVAFEDGVFLAKQIKIPYPESIEKPEIIDPKSAPTQGSTLSMKFNDVGADYYEVSANLCEEYANNGINPCLDGETYHLHKVDGEIEKQYDNESFEFVVSDDVITISSQLPMIYGESVIYYVNAQKMEGKNLVEASDEKTFTAN